MVQIEQLDNFLEIFCTKCAWRIDTIFHKKKIFDSFCITYSMFRTIERVEHSRKI